MATLLTTNEVGDPIRAGIANGWKVIDASRLAEDLMLETDVVIVGTGAGGGVAAEILTGAGLDVILVEEGPLKSSSDFRMGEAEAYADLYQESGARKTGFKSYSKCEPRHGRSLPSQVTRILLQRSQK